MAGEKKGDSVVEAQGLYYSRSWNLKEMPLLLERLLLLIITESYLTLCNSMDCSPPGSSVHGDSPGKNPGVSCYFLLQGIFLTQGLNPNLPHFWRILPPCPLWVLTVTSPSRKSADSGPGENIHPLG